MFRFSLFRESVETIRGKIDSAARAPFKGPAAAEEAVARAHAINQSAHARGAAVKHG